MIVRRAEEFQEVRAEWSISAESLAEAPIHSEMFAQELCFIFAVLMVETPGAYSNVMNHLISKNTRVNIKYRICHIIGLMLTLLVLLRACCV